MPLQGSFGTHSSRAQHTLNSLCSCSMHIMGPLLDHHLRRTTQHPLLPHQRAEDGPCVCPAPACSIYMFVVGLAALVWGPASDK